MDWEGWLGNIGYISKEREEEKEMEKSEIVDRWRVDELFPKLPFSSPTQYPWRTCNNMWSLI